MRQSKTPDGRTAQRETAWYLASQNPGERTAEGWAKLARGHWGVENQNHWRRDVCLLEDLKSYRGKQLNICAAFLLGRSVLLALNADWGTGNINALLEELRAAPTAVWSLAVRGRTTCRRILPRTSPRKSSSK